MHTTCPWPRCAARAGDIKRTGFEFIAAVFVLSTLGALITIPLAIILFA
jgi:hypothetical protein